MSDSALTGPPSTQGRDYLLPPDDSATGPSTRPGRDHSAGNLGGIERSQLFGAPLTTPSTGQSQLLQDLLASPATTLEIAILRLRVRQDRIAEIHVESGERALGSLRLVNQNQLDRIRENRDEMLRKLRAAKPGFWGVLGKVFSKVVAGVIGLCTCAAAVATVMTTGGAAWPVALLAVVSFNSAMSSFVGAASDISASAGGPTFSIFSEIGGPKGLSTLLDGLVVMNLGGVAAGSMTLAGEEDTTVIMAVSLSCGIAGAALMCMCDAKAATKFVGYADNIRRFTKVSRGAVEGVEGVANTASGSVSTVETKALADAKGLEADGVRYDADREQTQAFMLILVESSNDLLEIDQVMNRVLAKLIARSGNSLSMLASATPERA